MIGGVAAPRAVYAIGDSLIGTDAAGTQPLFHLRGMLGDGVYFKAQGVGGQTSAQIRARLQRDVLERTPKPDTCIVLAGVNDIQARRSAAEIIANLTAIYQRLLDTGVRPIALTIYPFGDHMSWTPAGELTRQQVRDWMHRWLPVELPEVEVVDVEDVLGDLSDPARPRIRADYVDPAGIHTNAAGAAAVARALVERSRTLARAQG
jgi:lysophospholipase L1-like esterase